ncbi:Oidioi.mRNA.OKI2018_I69.XSR.g16617.t1.cds [Oikopleura dioica]|uniref:Oidioi.mRNA.OKI2018_I69.XSR.g16617.t1.cds n=1 Tax=Oikopleura dioica TaxID=34765 RepID=A0ABN7SKP4_OIKDI|nr:Oidioi.mRNA.OKI2018_I69.XSR.g16617.t1.cds [Oikopleura dioica]
MIIDLATQRHIDRESVFFYICVIIVGCSAVWGCVAYTIFCIWYHMIKHKYLFDFGYHDDNQKAMIKKQAKLIEKEPGKVLAHPRAAVVIPLTPHIGMKRKFENGNDMAKKLEGDVDGGFERSEMVA